MGPLEHIMEPTGDVTLAAIRATLEAMATGFVLAALLFVCYFVTHVLKGK